jgi:hypothetical protein
MFRIFGSTFAVIVAVATLSFSAGCSSSDNTPADAGACTQAQVDTIFAANCTTCHDSTGTFANLNLTSNGLAGRLVGVAPPGGGSSPSMCAGMNKIYLVRDSSPATGLLLDKLTSNPGCGVRMPQSVAALSAANIACIQSWANTVTTTTP